MSEKFNFNNAPKPENKNDKPSEELLDIDQVNIVDNAIPEVESVDDISTNKAETKSNKIHENTRAVLDSYAWKEDFNDKDVVKKHETEAMQSAIDNYVDQVTRNLPDIDTIVLRNVVHTAVKDITDKVRAASDEIEARFLNEGKFEGYDHPEVKAIISSNLRDKNHSDKSLSRKILHKIGTPMQEAFGRAKYGEGEAGVVYKNVHTTVSRGGNVIAGGFFLEGMLAITNPIMAGVSTVLLYTGLQMMNEATNEHEMSTKQQKNPLQVMKKWGLILGAKSVPLALTALSTAAISTPKIAEHFADTEAKRVHTEFVSRQPSITLDPTTNQYVNNELDQNGNPKTLPTMYQEYNMAKQDATTLENQLSGDDITIQTYQREMEGLGSIQTPREPIKTRIDRLKKEIGVDSSKNNELEANFKSMTPAQFLRKYLPETKGIEANDKNFEAKTEELFKGLDHYNELEPGTRVENGSAYMLEQIKAGNYTDETFMRLWFASIIECLSLITLVLVQSRSDYKKLVTNSDAQGALGHVVEGTTSLVRQQANISRYEEVGIENPDSQSKKLKDLQASIRNEKIDKMYEALKNGEDVKIPNQVPSFKSLINSVVVQKTIHDMFKEGEVPFFNDIMQDISRDLIHPIPVDQRKKKRMSRDQLQAEKLAKEKEESEKSLVKTQTHDNEKESDSKYLINVPTKICADIRKSVLSNTQSLNVGQLAANLSIILSNNIPESGENQLKMMEELDKVQQKDNYSEFINRLEDLNSDVQDIIDTNGSSADRQDLKNSFKDKVRDAVKIFNFGEKYAGADDESLVELAKKYETKETSLSLNNLRLGSANKFILENVSNRSISPLLLNNILDALTSGDAVITSKLKEKHNKVVDNIKKLHLSSPYEPAVQVYIDTLEKIAANYSQKKMWMFGGQKESFRNEVVAAILKYKDNQIKDRGSKQN